MTEKKPTLEYRTPRPNGHILRTSRGERLRLILSFATILVTAGLIFAGCYLV